MNTVIDWIIFNDKNEILLTKKKDKWILPWGKQESWEQDEDTLAREVWEELDWAILEKTSLLYYDTFKGITPFSNKHIEVKVYFASLLSDALTPGREIGEIQYTTNPLSLNLSDITKEIIQSLTRDWFIESNKNNK